MFVVTRTTTHRVLGSDMMDEATTFTVWDTEQEASWNTGHPPEGTLFQHDIPDQWMDCFIRETQFHNVRCWVEGMIREYLSWEAMAWRTPRMGEKVEVYKGRKVPKGSYTVVRTGSGPYGPFADLKDNVGKVYRFVSESNWRPIQPTKEEHFSPDLKRWEGYISQLKSFCEGLPLPSLVRDKTPLLVMADEMEDMGDWRGPTVRAIARFEMVF